MGSARAARASEATSGAATGRRVPRSIRETETPRRPRCLRRWLSPGLLQRELHLERLRRAGGGEQPMPRSSPMAQHL